MKDCIHFNRISYRVHLNKDNFRVIAGSSILNSDITEGTLKYSPLND